MNIELTEAEALIITMYIWLARLASENDEARAGLDKIIQKLEHKETK